MKLPDTSYAQKQLNLIVAMAIEAMDEWLDGFQRIDRKAKHG